MPEVTITTKLAASDETVTTQDDRPTMIKVDHVSMEFNMASEKIGSLKEYVIAIAKRKLFFESLKALDDISIEVKKGDVYGILGTNGSGKSTLLKIIAGVLEPSSGSVEINGNIAPLIELGAGFDMELSARENIFLNGALLGYSKDFIQSHFDDIVKFAEVEKFLDMPMKNYSSGMVSRIAFAIATVIVPEILIVDEVLAVGDFMFQKKCEDRISELIEKHGVTVLIVSHSNDQVERLCNKAIWIEKGHTRIEGGAERVCNAYRILGGRTGSEQSERKVYEALNAIEGVKEDAKPKMYKGKNHFEVAANAVVHTWGKSSCDSVLLVPDHTHVYDLAAMGLAGMMNAPILPISEKEIPLDTLGALATLQPREIFVIAEEDAEFPHAFEGQLSELAERVTPILCEKGCKGICRSALEFGRENASWNPDAAFLSCFEESLYAFGMAPLAYRNKVPFLISDPALWNKEDAYVEYAQSLGVSKFYAIGAIAESPVTERLEGLGYEMVRIAAGDPISFFSKAFDVTAGSESTFGSGALVASSDPSTWQTLLTLGPVGGFRGLSPLLEDTTDLDSVAMCLSKTQGKVDDVAFMGFDDIMGLNARILSATQLQQDAD